MADARAVMEGYVDVSSEPGAAAFAAAEWAASQDDDAFAQTFVEWNNKDKGNVYGRKTPLSYPTIDVRCFSGDHLVQLWTELQKIIDADPIAKGDPAKFPYHVNFSTQGTTSGLNERK